MMKAKLLLFTFLILASVMAHAQTTKGKELAVEVQDGFLGIPLKDVVVTICSEDSTVLMDTIKVMFLNKANGKPDKIIYYATVNSPSNHFLIHAVREGYDEAWQPVTVKDPKAETT